MTETTEMTDTTVTKIDSSHSPTGTMEQKYLASGVHVALFAYSVLSAGSNCSTVSRRPGTLVSTIPQTNSFKTTA
jgi:hypothetical protein